MGLLAAVFYLNRRQMAHFELVEEMSEERRLLTEMRATVKEELDNAREQAHRTLEQATRIATEAELEVKNGGRTIAGEVEAVASQLADRFNQPLEELNKRQAAVESLLRRVAKERTIMTSLVSRGEKICKFFDEKVSYEDVLHEIEDKKYDDARHLLARGEKPGAVAKHLGMSESEVRLVAGLCERAS